MQEILDERSEKIFHPTAAAIFHSFGKFPGLPSIDNFSRARFFVPQQNRSIFGWEMMCENSQQKNRPTFRHRRTEYQEKTKF